MAPKAKPGVLTTNMVLCGCGMVLLLVLVVVMTVIVVKTLIDLARNPPHKGRLVPVSTRVQLEAKAVASTKVESKDVTDYPVLDQTDQDGPVPLRPEPLLREPPVFPSQDPFYPLRGHPSSFQQLGILSAMNEKTGEPTILPIFGKRIGSDRWNYYAATDQNTLWRIPVSQKGRDCSDRYTGCPEIYDGDSIFVPAYQKDFVVNMYPYRGPMF